MSIDIHYLAILLTGVSNMVLGMLWYSPALFGKTYIKEMGFTKEEMDAAKKKGMAKEYALAFVNALVMGFVLYHVIVFTGSEVLSEALQTAFWVWLGFSATTSLSEVLWGRDSWRLFTIKSGYWLVSLLVMALILTGVQM